MKIQAEKQIPLRAPVIGDPKTKTEGGHDFGCLQTPNSQAVESIPHAVKREVCNTQPDRGLCKNEKCVCLKEVYVASE